MWFFLYIITIYVICNKCISSFSNLPLTFLWPCSSEGALDFNYHDHDELTAFLRSVAATYPNLTALYSIGRSVQGEWGRDHQQGCRHPPKDDGPLLHRPQRAGWMGQGSSAALPPPTQRWRPSTPSAAACRVSGAGIISSVAASCVAATCEQPAAALYSIGRSAGIICSGAGIISSVAATDPKMTTLYYISWTLMCSSFSSNCIFSMALFLNTLFV